MKAVFFEEHGDMNVVQVGEQPDPTPGPGWVCLDVRAAALNHLDLWVRMGIPGMNPELPHIMGSDGAGTVTALGEGVESVSVGDEVVLNPGLFCGACEFCLSGEQSLCIQFHLIGEEAPGTFAEKVVVPAENLHPKPEALTWEEAAAFPLVFLTAYRMLFTRAGLGIGETILIHGIGGGVASAALQLAARAGARPIATSSSDAKLEEARALGAVHTINYEEEDVIERVQSLTGKRGVDVVVDTLAGPVWKQSQACVRKGGRIVTCGATLGPNPKTSIQRLFWRQYDILGSTMGSVREMQQVVALFEGEDGLRPRIDRVFDLEDAPEALKRLDAGKQHGKIVLRV